MAEETETAVSQAKEDYFSPETFVLRGLVLTDAPFKKMLGLARAQGLSHSREGPMVWMQNSDVVLRYEAVTRDMPFFRSAQTNGLTTRVDFLSGKQEEMQRFCTQLINRDYRVAIPEPGLNQAQVYQLKEGKLATAVLSLTEGFDPWADNNDDYDSDDYLD